MSSENTTYPISSNSSSGEFLLGPIDPREWYKYGFEFEVYGYFLPVMAVLIVFTNTTMLKVFVTKNLMSPTNMLIGTIALFDMLTVTMPSAIWFYFFGVLRYHYFLPFDWCRTWHDLAETMPSTFHGIVIVLNVVLVTQRYALMAYPYKTRYVCTRINTCISIILVIVIFSLPGFFALFEYAYFPAILPSMSNANETMIGCFVGISPWITNLGLERYIAIKLFARAVTVLLSSITASVFCILTLRKCKDVSRRRKQLTQNIKCTQNLEARLTMTTVAIIAAFLVTELPSIIIITIDAFAYITGKEIIPGSLVYTLAVVNNTLICSTGVLNFVIYFYFCEEFRRSCLESWCCQREKNSKTGRRVGKVNTLPVVKGYNELHTSDSVSSIAISGSTTSSSICRSSNSDNFNIVVHL